MVVDIWVKFYYNLENLSDGVFGSFWAIKLDALELGELVLCVEVIIYFVYFI